MLYPIQTESRECLDLSGIWNFALEKGQGFSEKWFTTPLKNPISMPVPSSYNDITESIEIRDHIGWVFYQRNLMISSTMKEKRLVLRFGSVTHHAKVYINGELVCSHTGGFLPFEIEINKFVNIGINLLCVAVSNILDDTTLPCGRYGEDDIPGMGKVIHDYPNFDFFNYAGIMRPVVLYATPHTFIKDITVVPHVSGQVEILFNVKNNLSSETIPVNAKITIMDKSEKIVAAVDFFSGSLNKDNFEFNFSKTLTIENPILWQPLQSYLYTAKVELSTGDCYELPFGIRSVKVEGNKFLINNKAFYFKGFGKHEDSAVHGRGFDEILNVKDINLLKWIGANSFRTSHYPYSEEMMRLADREGFVLIDEVPAVGLHSNFMATGLLGGKGKIQKTWEILKTEKHHHEVIHDMIERDKNYACVVMWSVANEPASEEPGAKEYFAPLVQQARDEDPQHRPVTIVTYGGSTPEDCKVAELVDVLGLNRYYGWYTNGGELDKARCFLVDELKRWHERCPSKPIIITEYGADAVVGLHDSVPVMFSEEYQKDCLKMNNDVFDSDKNIIGEHIWNFADFATAQNTMRVQGNKKGVFTRDRKPKTAAWYVKSRWEEIPDFDYK